LAVRLAQFGVTGLRPLSGGASSLTYTGTTEGKGDRRVVVKLAPPGLAPVRNRDVLRQARLMTLLHRTGVPVPEVLFEDEGSPPEVPPLFVMNFVEGRSFEPLFDRDGGGPDRALPPEVVAEAMASASRAMAALHRLDPSSLGLASEPRQEPRDEVARWRRSLETVSPGLAPGWSTLADQLEASSPPADPPSVIHGDFRLGNLLTVGSAVTSIVDWEIWAVGDARVDVGWFLLNADPLTYARSTGYESAVPATQELVDVYSEALGRRPERLSWFQALAAFKSVATWSLIVKHNRTRSNPDPSTEDMAAALPRLLERADQLLDAR
jgi:aminoglycoside phosphotransferase (APT) family kinase protein